MEFEQALYRVYDRSLDSLLQDRPLIDDVPQSKPRHLCTVCLHTLWFLALTMITCVIGLHANFVNDPGCLHTTMQNPRNVSTWMGEDEILQIRIAQSGLHVTEEEEEGAAWWSQAGESSSSSSRSSNNSSDSSSSTDVIFVPDYIYTSNTPLLYLDSGFLARHEVKRINVTLDEMCVTKGPGLGFVVGAVVGDLDTIIINQLMYTFRSDGTARNMRTNETWSWRGSSLPPVGGYRLFTLDGWVSRLFALLRSLLALFFLSGTTAIVVRMLMTSGVALMYPFFFCLRRMGVTGLSFRVLTRSYAWLGVPLERLRARGKPLAPFLLAHLSKMVVVYVMYEACQVFWVETLYGKSGGSGMAFAVFGLVMLMEYVSMLYVRSALSIRYFPRVVLFYLLAFHLYYYLVPYGFTSQLLLATALLLLHAVLYILLFLELPAFRASIISHDTPRAFYTDTGLPSHPHSIPPSWSLFLPLTLGRRGGRGEGRGGGGRGGGGVYDEEVPERPVGGLVLGGRLQALIVEVEEGRQERRGRQQRNEQQEQQQLAMGHTEEEEKEGGAFMMVGGEGNEEGHVALAVRGQRGDAGEREEGRPDDASEEGEEGGQEEGPGFGRRRGYQRLRNDERF
ncbi:Hypothetical protein NocV09_00203590 [Nannochloropsis oceanica]